MYPSAHTIQIPCLISLFQFRIRPSSTSLAENFRPLSDASASFLGTGRATAVFQFRIRPSSTKPMLFLTGSSKGRMPQTQSHPPFRISMYQSLVLNLHDGGAAHAAADAQGGQAGLRALGLHLMEQGHQDTASGSAHGMSQSDSAAVGVQLLVYIYP